MIFNMVGGAGLNFKIIGNPQPASADENTIWVDTDIPITGYSFSVDEPANPIDGYVWISTSTFSPIEFNALKKNGIMVYPLSAKQYVIGAWVDVVAKIYQGSEWVDWIDYLFNYGNQRYTWSCEDMPIAIAGNQAKKKPTAQINADGSVKISINYTSGSLITSGAYKIVQEIDLTNATELIFTVKDIYGSVYFSVCPVGADAWGIDTNFGGDAVVYGSSIGNKDELVQSLDVSALKGSYTIIVGVAAGSEAPIGYWTLQRVEKR